MLSRLQGTECKISSTLLHRKLWGVSVLLVLRETASDTNRRKSLLQRLQIISVGKNCSKAQVSAMRSPQITRRNHYVPQSYLKRWAGADGKLFAYRLLVNHANVRDWLNVTPAAVGYHEHLYTQMATGELSDAFERWLSHDFESPAEPVIRRAIDGGRLTREDWITLARFVGCQDVRTPARLVAMLKRQTEQMPKILDETLEEVISKLKEANTRGRHLEPLPDRPLNESRIPSCITVKPGTVPEESLLKVEVVIGRESWLSSLHHLLTRTCRALEKHRWTILRPAGGMRWVTSDNPVLKLNYHSSDHYDFGGGWASFGTEIFLPLGPEHLLYTQIGNLRPLRRDTRLDEGNSRRIQQMLLENAHRIVFASTPDKKVPRFRPRLADANQHKAENEQWRKWHAEQVAAELPDSFLSAAKVG